MPVRATPTPEPDPATPELLPAAAVHVDPSSAAGVVLPPVPVRLLLAGREFTLEERAFSQDMLASAHTLLERLHALPESRERDRAIDKLQEAVMWANRAIAVSGVLGESPATPMADT